MLVRRVERKQGYFDCSAFDEVSEVVVAHLGPGLESGAVELEYVVWLDHFEVRMKNINQQLIFISGGKASLYLN